ncbi:hypothetical protein AUJ14_03765 [Candidatus Micrarchaeota archaeon CG1_02_55_22]|nr:MAG: hypothetical protein AUJ14_03765 [Candidatus Micrarchaeota archaeon CG1_02_55_22]
MPLTKTTVSQAVEQAIADGKGKRKFTQSVDLAINLAGLDFRKPENRLNLSIILPFPPKESPVAIFADGQAATEAKAVVDLVISSADLPSYATDKAKQAELLKYSLLATPPLMAQVGKVLGPVLAPKGKMPKPILPNSNLKSLVDSAKRSISVRTKGKNLPVVHCIVGRENLAPEQITENVLAVVEAVFRKTGEKSVAKIFIKTTMGKSFAVVN